MKKLIIELPPERKIEINGVVFDVAASDVEILELLSEIAADCERLADSQSVAEITAVLKNTFSVLDKILGEGAAEKILMGRAASISFMLESVISPILREVLDMARSSYEKRVEEEYGERLGAACEKQ